MNLFKVLKYLPLLDNYGKDIDFWIDEFKSKLELFDVQESRKEFILARECVNEELRYVIDDLKIKKNTYPTLEEIKTAIEDYLEITQIDKYQELIDLKIKINETISNFNIKYMRKYNNLNNKFKKLITTDNYVESIIQRTYPCMRILESGCNNIEEAIKISNKAERIERKLNLRIPCFQKRDNNKYIWKTNENISKINYNGKRDIDKRYNKNNKIMCFRCYELGHKALYCRHSFKQLAIMEEEGILEMNKRRNFIPNLQKNYWKRNNNNYNNNHGLSVNKVTSKQNTKFITRTNRNAKNWNNNNNNNYNFKNKENNVNNKYYNKHNNNLYYNMVDNNCDAKIINNQEIKTNTGVKKEIKWKNTCNGIQINNNNENKNYLNNNIKEQNSSQDTLVVNDNNNSNTEDNIYCKDKFNNHINSDNNEINLKKKKKKKKKKIKKKKKKK